MLVVGQKEQADGTVSVRSRFKGDEGAEDLNVFIANIKAEIAGRVNLPTVIFRNMIPSFGKKCKQTDKKQKKSRSPENSEDRRKSEISASG